MHAHPFQRCQPCARPHSAGSVAAVPPLTIPQAPQSARLMTALPSMAVLRPLQSAQTSDLQNGKFQTCPPPGQVRSVSRVNNKAVSVEPSAPQPSPPMPSIRLRTCETCGFLSRRLLRSAILTPCGQGLRSFRLHYAHSAPKSPRLTGGPQNDSGVRSAHELTGNLQDCPNHTARHIYRHSITAVLQDTYQEPFSQAHLIENSILFRIASRHINRLTHTPLPRQISLHIHKGQSAIPRRLLIYDGTAPLYAVSQSAST